MTDDADRKPYRNTCLRLSVLAFVFLFLLVGVCLRNVTAGIGTEPLPQSILLPIVVLGAAVVAFIPSRLIFVGLRSGRIPYPLSFRLIHSLRQAITFGRWRLSAVLSSALLALVVLAWMRSHWRADLMSIPFSETTYTRFVSCSGIIMVEYFSLPDKKKERGHH